MSLISFYFTSFVYGKTFSLYVVLIRQRRADSTDCVFLSFFFYLDTDLLQRQVNQGGLESSGPGKTLRRRTLPSAERGGLIIDFTRLLILLFTTLQVQQKRRR